jgi:hypothetical protein
MTRATADIAERDRDQLPNAISITQATRTNKNEQIRLKNRTKAEKETTRKFHTHTRVHSNQTHGTLRAAILFTGPNAERIPHIGVAIFLA